MKKRPPADTQQSLAARRTLASLSVARQRATASSVSRCASSYATSRSIPSAATRPPLAGGGIEEVREMLAQREPVYLECAELVLDATRPPEQLAGAVIAALRERSRA